MQQHRGAGRGEIRVLCAPDSFKGTISAAEAADAMAAGVEDAAKGHPQRSVTADRCPIGDGGEGTLDALALAMNLERRSARVMGPLGTSLTAQYGLSRDGRIAVVELAEASGLTLLKPDERDPMRATTYGTGQLVRYAVDAGCREIIICIGGSATVDGGCGMAQALGVRFFDHDDREITGPICGGLLARIGRIDRSNPCLDPTALHKPPSTQRSVPGTQQPISLRVACDVTNPLLGQRGAAAVYGPQKGASSDAVRELERGLANLARVCSVDSGMPGSGAAGGAGYGLMALCGARLERGIDLVLDAVRFDDRCCGASVVLTGEGCLDEQSLEGKACMGVTRAAARRGVPAIAIVGQTSNGWRQCIGSIEDGRLTEVISLRDRFGEDHATRHAANLIAQVAREIIARRFIQHNRTSSSPKREQG